MSVSTAILFFTRGAQAEVASKQLRLGKATTSVKVMETLMQHNKRVARQAGLPLITVSLKQQVGRTFGERFSNAIQYCFEQGFERVIAIGSDILALSAKQLHIAAKQLDRQKSILGPSKDGGAYLVGLHRDHFDAAVFQTLPWQTAHLYQALQHYFQTVAQEVCSLQTRDDVDSIQDLWRFLKAAPLSFLAKQLLQLLQSIQQYYLLHQGSLSSLNNRTTYFNKPPPSLS